MRILALNCGSSSIKSVVVETASGTRVFERARELDAAGHAGALEALLNELRERSLLDGIQAAGHRVVHGGERFRASVLLDARVLDEIEAVASMAPLHNPANLQGIRALQRALPSLPQVAVFDTAFHQTLPPRAYLYAVPYALYRDHGVRRYGFHGSSHRFVATDAARRLGRSLEQTQLVSAHLGNGCSATAIRDGVSVDTSMGLSPLEGLVMGTRSGDVDPGLHEFLSDRLGLDLAEVTALLNRESGLLGLSELSSDMRELERARREGHEGAERAIESFCYRLARQVAGLSVALDRLDALVFTGGIGERSPYVRARVLELLGSFGFELDSERNALHGAESNGEISRGARPVALVVPTDEERLIAEETAAVLQRPAGERC